MWQKLSVLALAVAAVSFASAPRAKAGVEMVEPENAPTTTYHYAPPPEPVYYARPVIGVAIYPSFGYYPGPFGYYGYHRYYGGHRYYGSRGYWRGGSRHWR